MNAMQQITEGRAGRSGHEAADDGIAPASASFTMPIPPSVNQLFRNLPGRGRVKTRIYDNWRAHAVTAIRLQRVDLIEGPVLVFFGVERVSSGSDIDNRIKAMLDAIVEAGVIVDDSLVAGFAAAWLPPANGLAHVQVLTARPVTIHFQPSADRATGGFFMAQPNDGDA